VKAMIEVSDGGFGNAIQDAGRFGSRSIGVPVSGAADRVLLACANLLLGNDPAAAAIEVTLAGPRLKALEGEVRCALAGGIDARLLRGDGSQLEVAGWQTVTLRPGDTLAVGSARGPGYLAISGGCLVAPQLGSRSTYARAGLGGVDGRLLRSGDCIACAPLQGDPWLEFRAGSAFAHPAGPLRVIAGPQQEAFTEEALQIFYGQEFEVTRELDRMGIRLAGPPLGHRPECGADIVSDGITPGAIQVPGNGQPIVLGPDCQTVGGYAKIATVISADLPRLAHLVPGERLRFAAVSQTEARRAWRDQQATLDDWRAAIESFRPPGAVDEAALYSTNLVSGIVDACGFRRGLPPDLPWE